MAVMLYKKGVELIWEGLHLATKIVDEAEVEAHVALGWVTHPHHTIEVPLEAKHLEEPVPAPVADQTAAAGAALNAPPAVLNPFAPKT